MTIQELENKKILLVGYAKEGKATEAFLQANVPSAQITIADQSQGAEYLVHQTEFDLAIKSAGIHADLLKIPYTTATNIFFAHVKGMTIGITGTKGKSTTTSLIYSILKQAGKKAHLVGNIGNPMLSELVVSNEEDDIWVCELSSYQLADITYSPHIAVLVSLFPEHMDYHGGVTAYFQAKANITAFQTEKDFLVYNSQFDALKKIAEETKARKIPFISALPFDKAIVPLLGEHNQSNVRGAVTVAQLLGIAARDTEEAVRSFQPLRHRLQRVGMYTGITFFDDAISTTPQSTLAALSAIPNVGTLMLGGHDRGYDFEELVAELVRENIQNLVLFPESGAKILHLLEKYPEYHPRVLQTSSMQEAVVFAYAQTPEGEVCLLSTASPSYTLWKNFEEKGDEFQKIVKELGEKK